MLILSATDVVLLIAALVLGALIGAAFVRLRRPIAPAALRDRADETQQRLAAIVASSTDAVIGKTLDGTVTDWNAAAERIFGYTAAEMVGQPIYRIIPPELHAAEHSLLARIARGEQLEFSETERLRKDGTHIYIALTVSPIRDRTGKVIGASSIKRDITERKRIDAELARRDQRLRQAERMEAVGRLAGGIAHEANNQMTVVLGAVQFILRRTDIPEAVREDVQHMRRAAERTAGVTQQLLAFSRRQMLQPQLVDLNAAITTLKPILERTLGEMSSLALRLEAAAGRVMIDPGQLDQVLINLALNARDAMPRGGLLNIETASVTVDGRHESTQRFEPMPSGEYARMTVSDTGEGMDPGTLERIFEPFFTTKDLGCGTGLGLATVYGIVKQSGGFIAATSALGRGTRLVIHIPMAGSAAPRPSDPGPTPRAGEHETILLVEDEPSVRGILSRGLRYYGYTVLEAANGADALALLDESARPIDALVADVVMPSMGGRELALLLRRRQPDLPVVLISGYTGHDAGSQDLPEEHGYEYLQKPLAPEALARKVREVLEAGVRPAP